MSDDLRYRFKSKPSKETKNLEKSDGGIFGIWDEQKRMQAEEDKIVLELARAKRKAKDLQKTLRTHRYGEIKNDSIEKIIKTRTQFASNLNKTIQYIKKILSKNKKATSLVSAVVAVFLIFGIFSLIGLDKKNTLGVSSSVNEELPVDGSIDSLPEFSVLYPSDKDVANLQSVTRQAPDGNVIHTYRDSIKGIELELTQQELPDNFRSDQENQLLEVATNFQATNIIQINDQKVYTGVNEKTGIQSIFTIKDGKFISIKALQELTDDDWTGYILSLK